MNMDILVSNHTGIASTILHCSAIMCYSVLVSTICFPVLVILTLSVSVSVSVSVSYRCNTTSNGPLI